MKNLRILVIIAVVVVGTILTGCASMQISYLEEDTVVGPRQVRQGQNINPREITVWAIYRNGDRRVVSVSQSDITFNRHTPGPQQVRVRVGVFNNYVVYFTTEVMALRSLTVASPPRTTIFKQGDMPDPTWPGLELRGEWDGMGSHRIDIADCEISGFLENQAGRQTIRISYEGLTETFDIDVRSMASIQIAQTPLKMDYIQGEPLDLTGLRVMGVWEGFPTEELPVAMNNIAGFNPNNSGIQRVSITINERTAYFDVEVMALSRIVLEKPPTKTDYVLGEPLDLTGIEVSGFYTGADPTRGRTELIPIEQLEVSGYDPMRIGRQQRVTVIVGGQIANFFINIELPPQ